MFINCFHKLLNFSIIFINLLFIDKNPKKKVDEEAYLNLPEDIQELMDNIFIL